MTWASNKGIPAALLVAAAIATSAAEPLLDELRTIADADKPDDLELLTHTCFTEFEDWLPDPAAAAGSAWTVTTFPDFTRLANAAKGQPFPPRAFVRPTETLASLAGWFAVPETGSYRIWLGQMLEPGRQAPVALRLSGATTAEHLFGEQTIPRGEPGHTIEAKAPVRFETDEARTMPALRPAPVWEYWDVDLKQGATRLELAPRSTNAALEALLLTRSKRFTPARALDATHNTLTQVFLRYRVSPAGAAAGRPPVTLSSQIMYNWEHNDPSSPSDISYGSVGDIKGADGNPALAPGQWSAWVNATAVAVTRRGRYATDNLTLASTAGPRPTHVVVEVQYAWFPHPAAVLREVRAEVTSGAMRYTIPATRLPYRAVRPGADAGSAAWGARDRDHTAFFRGEKAILDDLFTCLDGLDTSRLVMPRRLVFYTQCGVSPEYRELAVSRLKALGFNALGFARAENERFGLLPHTVATLQEPRTHTVGDTHDPGDPTFEAKVRAALEKRFPEPTRNDVTLFGMGDEIGPLSPNLIRETADGRRAFHDYLAGECERLNTNAGFFGAPTLDRVVYPLERPFRASRQQRRLWFHAEDFLWRHTSGFFRRYTRAINAVLPQARTWCNVSPGSFMNTGTMRRSNWFALPRYGGSTMGWGEDWLRGRDVQPVSYYAAILACATRKNRLPSGFYLVGRTGNLDRKMLSLVGRGIHFIHVYTWGPEYVGTVPNFFSHTTNAYPEIIRGVQALAPAEDILTQGAPEPRRAALLYNLTNEHWNDALAAMHRDRLHTFLALLHAHVPVDVILEEDLTPETLAAYPVVYINGFNMQKRHVLALTDWVKAGGTLVAASGAALRDEYDDPMPEAEVLFGARQRLAGEPDQAVAPMAEPDDDAAEAAPSAGDQAPAPTAPAADPLALAAGELTPAASLPALGAKLVLTPTTGKPAGAYAGGACGAVIHDLGKGRVLLLGLMPGHAYAQALAQDPARAAAARDVIAQPALAALGPLTVAHTEPLVEVARFDHASGIAVLLADFTYKPGQAATLTVRTDRDITEVVATRGGKLEWKREGDAIVIQAPVPDPVDVVILR